MTLYMLLARSSAIAQIETHPPLLPATKNFPFGLKLKVEISKRELISAAIIPVPSS
jgi:hypothetical protein